MAINIIYWLLVFSSGLYLLVMLIMTMGWFKLKVFPEKKSTVFLPVSVVVAVRNEENNIKNLLNCLEAQSYSKEQIEVILVDDHSEDKTVEIIQDFILKTKLKIILISASKEGKKNALSQGFAAATGQLFITTDGDCQMQPEWLEILVEYFTQFNPVIIAGPVLYQQDKRVMQKLFSLDFMSLVASGAGSIGAKLPLMANGANLAFSAEAYRKVSGQSANQHFASGDDTFLLHQLAKQFGSEKIHFIKSSSATIITKSPDNLNIFLSQRKRWASKARGYQNLWAKTAAIVVLLFNISMCVVFFSGFSKIWFFAIYLLFVVFKFLIDFPLIHEFSGFAGRRNLIWLLFPFEIIYPFYISYTAVISLIFRFQWKGRNNLR